MGRRILHYNAEEGPRAFSSTQMLRARVKRASCRPRSQPRPPCGSASQDPSFGEIGHHVSPGCLVSHEPLWSQGAGDVDMPEAVTVHSEGARPLSILIPQAGNAAAERPHEMEVLIGSEGKGRFL